MLKQWLGRACCPRQRPHAPTRIGRMPGAGAGLAARRDQAPPRAIAQGAHCAPCRWRGCERCAGGRAGVRGLRQLRRGGRLAAAAGQLCGVASPRARRQRRRSHGRVLTACAPGALRSARARGRARGAAPGPMGSAAGQCPGSRRRGGAQGGTARAPSRPAAAPRSRHAGIRWITGLCRRLEAALACAAAPALRSPARSARGRCAQSLGARAGRHGGVGRLSLQACEVHARLVTCARAWEQAPPSDKVGLGGILCLTAAMRSGGLACAFHCHSVGHAMHTPG